MNSKVALVTGASRGIGAATAKRLAEAGYIVVVNFHKQSAAADQVVHEIESSGGRAFAIQADVSDEASVMRMFAELDTRCQRLDVLINNAGILETQCRVRDITADRLHRIMAVNVIGTMICCREALQRMQSGAAIVNVSSVASRLGAPFEYVDYAASKGAIDSLTIGLSKEVAADGIRVNAVRPGFIATDIHADGGDPGRVDRIGPSLPMGRGGTAEEVADAIFWLASDQSSFTTGSFIDLAGGK